MTAIAIAFPKNSDKPLVVLKKGEPLACDSPKADYPSAIPETLRIAVPT